MLNGRREIQSLKNVETETSSDSQPGTKDLGVRGCCRLVNPT